MTGPADPDSPGADSVSAAPSTETEKAFFSIVSGALSAEELAALTVVLAAASSRGEPKQPTPRNGWASPDRRMRTIGTASPGGWRAEHQPQ